MGGITVCHNGRKEDCMKEGRKGREDGIKEKGKNDRMEGQRRYGCRGGLLMATSVFYYKL